MVPLIDAVGVGLTFTVVEAVAEGPLQPLAKTLTVSTPLNEGDHVTVPAVPVPEIVFPAPSTVHTYPVAFVAEVVNTDVVVPWQIVVAEGTGTDGMPTLAGTVTVPLAHSVVLHAPPALT